VYGVKIISNNALMAYMTRLVQKLYIKNVLEKLAIYITYVKTQFYNLITVINEDDDVKIKAMTLEPKEEYQRASATNTSEIVPYKTDNVQQNNQQQIPEDIESIKGKYLETNLCFNIWYKDTLYLILFCAIQVDFIGITL